MLRNGTNAVTPVVHIDIYCVRIKLCNLKAKFYRTIVHVNIHLEAILNHFCSFYFQSVLVTVATPSPQIKSVYFSALRSSFGDDMSKKRRYNRNVSVHFPATIFSFII